MSSPPLLRPGDPQLPGLLLAAVEGVPVLAHRAAHRWALPPGLQVVHPAAHLAEPIALHSGRGR